VSSLNENPLSPKPGRGTQRRDGAHRFTMAGITDRRSLGEA